MALHETIVLHAPVNAHDLGPGHVDLHLFPPTGDIVAHAMTATVPVGSGEGIAHVHFRYPLHESPPLTVAPGLITVGSAQKSSLSLFCMGGQAAVSSEPNISTLSLRSDAPILLFGKSIYDDDTEPVDLLVAELESWLSLLRARAHGNEAAFERALLRIPPLHLYAQGLLLALQELGEVPVDERSEPYWRSSKTLHAALRAAQERPGYPNPLPNFEALLAV